MRRSEVVLAVIAMTILVGCSNKQRLGEYDFRNRTVAIVTIGPSHPEILGGIGIAPFAGDPVDRVVSIGSAIAVGVSARQAQPRLESAADSVDVKGRMSDRILDGAARHLRAVPTDDNDGADFEIEVRIYNYGISASSWSANTQFVLDAELFLLDGESGRRVWKSRVRETTPVSPLVWSGDRAVDGAVSAIALASLSTEEIARHLENLADFAADRLTLELARALDETRQ